MGVGDRRVAQVGDPARAGRALHRRADEVDRVRRRGRDHDVDLVLADEPDRGGDRGQVPRDVLVGHERAAAEQPRLGRSAREALLAVQLLGGLAADRADVARPVHPGLRRHAERLVAVDPLRVVRGEDVRLDPERRQVLGELQGTLHASPARRGKVEADEQHLHPGDGTGARLAPWGRATPSMSVVPCPMRRRSLALASAAHARSRRGVWPRAPSARARVHGAGAAVHRPGAPREEPAEGEDVRSQGALQARRGRGSDRAEGARREGRRAVAGRPASGSRVGGTRSVSRSVARLVAVDGLTESQHPAWVAIARHETLALPLSHASP